jgi:hypothetical protein
LVLLVLEIFESVSDYDVDVWMLESNSHSREIFPGESNDSLELDSVGELDSY